jgi:flagellar biosynthesis protein FlhA
VVQTQQAQERQQATQRRAPKPEAELRLDPLELEVGYGLVRLVDRSKGGDLLDRVQAIRHQMAQELGIMLPPVRIRDNVELEPTTYRLKIKGVPVASGTAYADQYLAMDNGVASGRLQGVQTVEPAFGLKATWIGNEQRERAEALGYTVVDAVSVVATHLNEVIRQHADELLTREQVKKLLDQLREAAPTVVEEVVPEIIKLGQLQQVLQNMLRERVSIRDLETVLETLGDYGARTSDPDILTEYVRHNLSRAICEQHRSSDGTLHVVTLDPALEDRIAAAVEHTDRGSFLNLPPAMVEKITRSVRREMDKLTAAGHSAVVLSSPQVRMHLKRMTESALPAMAVLSFNEIPREVNVDSMGMVVDET